MYLLIIEHDHYYPFLEPITEKLFWKAFFDYVALETIEDQYQYKTIEVIQYEKKIGFKKKDKVDFQPDCRGSVLTRISAEDGERYPLNYSWQILKREVKDLMIEPHLTSKHKAIRELAKKLIGD